MDDALVILRNGANLDAQLCEAQIELCRGNLTRVYQSVTPLLRDSFTNMSLQHQSKLLTILAQMYRLEQGAASEIQILRTLIKISSNRPGVSNAAKRRVCLLLTTNTETMAQALELDPFYPPALLQSTDASVIYSQFHPLGEHVEIDSLVWRAVFCCFAVVLQMPQAKLSEAQRAVETLKNIRKIAQQKRTFAVDELQLESGLRVAGLLLPLDDSQLSTLNAIICSLLVMIRAVKGDEDRIQPLRIEIAKSLNDSTASNVITNLAQEIVFNSQQQSAAEIARLGPLWLSMISKLCAQVCVPSDLHLNISNVVSPSEVMYVNSFSALTVAPF